MGFPERPCGGEDEIADERVPESGPHPLALVACTVAALALIIFAMALLTSNGWGRLCC